MATILVGGDVVSGAGTLPRFEAGDAAGVLHDLLPEFEAADLSVVNLECPLITTESPIAKTGRAFGVPASAVRALRSAHVDAVNLANNHILDHGPDGLRSTLEACRDAGIATVGAGLNLDEAGRMLIQSVGGVRVALLGVAEHEWSIATPDSAGANPTGERHYVRTLRRYAGEYDVLIVLAHAGLEMYPYPSPRLQDVCRFMIEEGASAVICQHSHCPGCCETYRGGVIVYGQGNLLFEFGRVLRPQWYEGFLVRLHLEAGKLCGFDVVPTEHSRGGAGARRMAPERQREFLRELDQRGERIGDEAFLRDEWLRHCRILENTYLSLLHGQGLWLRRLNARLPWLKHWYSPAKRRWLLNVVRCESHREAIETLFG